MFVHDAAIKCAQYLNSTFGAVMERREPTLAGSTLGDEPSPRRAQTNFDDGRSSRIAATHEAPKSATPTVALVIAILGVVACAILGWMLSEANAAIARDSARIQQLENQLNVTSSESTQSVTALGINLQRLDGEVKSLTATTRKAASDLGDKIASQGRGLDSAKAEIANLKAETSNLKQESVAHKASIEELAPRLDLLEKATVEQRKKLQDTSASVNALVSQVKSAEALATRITKTEEAIDAIDDNRRTINRDLMQIKQQLGIKN